MDECQVNNGGCQQTCINIPGRRICDCKSGFSLKDNSMTECEGKARYIEINYLSMNSSRNDRTTHYK